jgi:hypothetical protein
LSDKTQLEHLFIDILFFIANLIFQKFFESDPIAFKNTSYVFWIFIYILTSEFWVYIPSAKSAWIISLIIKYLLSWKYHSLWEHSKPEHWNTSNKQSEWNCNWKIRKNSKSKLLKNLKILHDPIIDDLIIIIVMWVPLEVCQK